VRFVDDPPTESVLYYSDWIVLTADERFAQALRDAGGAEIPPTRGQRQPWTDDHHNLFEVLK